MQRVKFSINILATSKIVWQTLWDESTYGKWTALFCEGSHVITDWNEGSKALFLSQGGKGMYSIIEKKIPNQFMSIKHLGCLKNGTEDPGSESSKAWAGAFENYTLTPAGETTKLEIELDITDENKNYFEETWPKALEKVKQLAENPT